VRVIKDKVGEEFPVILRFSIKSYMKDWCTFVKELIKRYDGDGNSDAFQMSFSVLRVLNVSSEVEAANNWTKHGGTVSEYDRLLTFTTKCVKEVNPSIQVARGAANFANHFANMSVERALSINEATVRKNPTGKFFLDSIEKEDRYDLMGLQLNYDWSGVVPEVAWVRNQLRKYGYSKSIFGNHVRSTKIDNKAESILRRTSDKLWQLTKKQYYTEQASETIKKLVVGLTSGLEFMSIATVFDAGYRSQALQRMSTQAVSWAFTGLLEADAVKKGKSLGDAAKPVYYSYKLLIDKLVGASRKVETMNLGENIYAYKFKKNKKPIIVAWYNGSAGRVKSASISTSSNRVSVTNIITDIKQLIPKTEILEAKDGKVVLNLTNTPIFIEEL